MIGDITIVVMLAGWKHASNGLRLEWQFWACIYIRIYYRKLLAGKYLDLVSGTLLVVFSLQGGKEVTPLFVGHGTNTRIFVLHIILHGYG